MKRIPVSDVTVPTAPPKIILKRKEIQISPQVNKLPANLGPPAKVKEVEANRPNEIEDFEMINESQDLPAVGDETLIESSASQASSTSPINAIEPQTRREPTGELMEDGVSQEKDQAKPESASNDKGEESQRQSELRSELKVEETLQESSPKASDDSQSMDYEFKENLFSHQLSEEANARVSPKEVVIYLKLPVTSSQLAVDQQGQGIIQPHLEDLNDVSYIIMSPTTPDKEDIMIDAESEKYNATASQLLLAHEEEVPFVATQLSTRHATIKTEETRVDVDITLCEDP